MYPTTYITCIVVHSQMMMLNVKTAVGKIIPQAKICLGRKLQIFCLVAKISHNLITPDENFALLTFDP